MYYIYTVPAKIRLELDGLLLLFKETLFGDFLCTTVCNRTLENTVHFTLNDTVGISKLNHSRSYDFSLFKFSPKTM